MDEFAPDTESTVRISRILMVGRLKAQNQVRSILEERSVSSGKS